jgi:hypothetical protein
MSYYIVKSIKKSEKYIISNSQVLGNYDIDANLIAEEDISKTQEIYGGLNSIFTLRDDKFRGDYGFYNLSEFDFVERAASHSTGDFMKSINEKNIQLAFCPKKVLTTIEKLIGVIDNVENEYIEEYNEKESLKNLIKLTKESVDNDEVLWCYYE